MNPAGSRDSIKSISAFILATNLKIDILPRIVICPRTWLLRQARGGARFSTFHSIGIASTKFGIVNWAWVSKRSYAFRSSLSSRRINPILVVVVIVLMLLLFVLGTPPLWCVE